MTSLERFIGIPWKVGGRDFDGVDCGGLCMLAACHLYGITIPDLWSYDDTDNLQVTEQVLQDLPRLAVRVAGPVNGVVVALQLSTGYVHYGLCVDGRMLHISEDTKSRLSRRIPQGNRVTYWDFGRAKGGERAWA